MSPLVPLSRAAPSEALNEPPAGLKNRLLRQQDLAELFGLTRAQVRKEVAAGQLPSPVYPFSQKLPRWLWTDVVVAMQEAARVFFAARWPRGSRGRRPKTAQPTTRGPPRRRPRPCRRRRPPAGRKARGRWSIAAAEPS